MDLAIIIVGIGKWQEFTKPALDSIRKHEPDARIIVVDAASPEKYPKYKGVKILRLDPSPSYAYAINKGIEAAGAADWYLILNNDVYLHGSISATIANQHPGFIYGRQIIEEKGHRWLGLWLALISREVWQAVGQFDEKFLLCGFEDADYCLRAKKLGIPTMPVELPFHHYWGKTRWSLPSYEKVRQDNIDYLASKHGVVLGAHVVVTHD